MWSLLQNISKFSLPEDSAECSATQQPDGMHNNQYSDYSPCAVAKQIVYNIATCMHYHSDHDIAIVVSADVNQVVLSSDNDQSMR